MLHRQTIVNTQPDERFKPYLYKGRPPLTYQQVEESLTHQYSIAQYHYADDGKAYLVDFYNRLESVTHSDAEIKEYSLILNWVRVNIFKLDKTRYKAVNIGDLKTIIEWQTNRYCDRNLLMYALSHYSFDMRLNQSIERVFVGIKSATVGRLHDITFDQHFH